MSRIAPQGVSWTAGSEVTTHASMSEFIMDVIMWTPVANRGQTPWAGVDRHAHGGMLDGLLNHSPHQPPNGCTAVVAGRVDDHDPPLECRILLLTSFDMQFVAYVALGRRVDTNIVVLRVFTTEPPVGGASDAFKDRRPTTAPLVRGMLSNSIADMALSKQEEEADDEEDGADGDGDDDGVSDEDLDGNGDVDRDDDQQQEKEEEDDEGVEEREAKRRRTAG
ncbi:unnamed protein product [Vitrella brassicaformis CCMP3155]|uniref:Uncharacterized protein n=1 Tax=Vitrella brassicaformis (strain CCMP3155) TaxID=1169540 RepID=A0A0G4FQR9_VITBC|nr:unnamed protein product [Vitrella brassicaformis CCMP3155]|eukprot:CEM16796.1 unnamed protein product [Vitrella brassicaformis CCMP3155]